METDSFIVLELVDEVSWSTKQLAFRHSLKIVCFKKKTKQTKFDWRHIMSIDSIKTPSCNSTKIR